MNAIKDFMDTFGPAVYLYGAFIIFSILLKIFWPRIKKELRKGKEEDKKDEKENKEDF